MFSISDDSHLNSRPTNRVRMSGRLIYIYIYISFVCQDPPRRDKLFASGFGFIDFLVQGGRVQELNFSDLCKSPTLLPSTLQTTFQRHFLPTFAGRVPSFLALSTAVTSSVLLSLVLCSLQRFPVCATLPMHREFVNQPFSLRTYTHRPGSMIGYVPTRSRSTLTCHIFFSHQQVMDQFVAEFLITWHVLLQGAGSIQQLPSVNVTTRSRTILMVDMSQPLGHVTINFVFLIVSRKCFIAVACFSSFMSHSSVMTNAQTECKPQPDAGHVERFLHNTSDSIASSCCIVCCDSSLLQFFTFGSSGCSRSHSSRCSGPPP